MRLVLGDDHRMFLDALTAGLESRGHDVVGCSDRIDDLVDVVEEGLPDLCVLDVDFGGRSVLGTAAAIRQRHPEISLVLLSGEAPAEVWSAYETGVVDGVVNKLCDLSALNRALERVRAGERVVERFARPVRPRRSTCEAARLSGRERRAATTRSRLDPDHGAARGHDRQRVDGGQGGAHVTLAGLVGHHHHRDRLGARPLLLQHRHQ